MHLVVTCPCGKKLRVAPHAAAKRVRCPACGHGIDVRAAPLHTSEKTSSIDQGPPSDHQKTAARKRRARQRPTLMMAGIGVALVVVVVFAAVSVLLLRKGTTLFQDHANIPISAPIYGGKTIDDWIDVLRTNRRLCEREQVSIAVEASGMLSLIGDAAIPALEKALYDRSTAVECENPNGGNPMLSAVDDDMRYGPGVEGVFDDQLTHVVPTRHPQKKFYIQVLLELIDPAGNPQLLTVEKGSSWAAMSLARLGSSATPILVRALADSLLRKDQEACIDILRAFRYMGPKAKDCNATLVPLLKEPDPELRRAVLRALATIDPSALGSYISEALFDSNADVYREATWLLKQVNKRTNPSAPARNDSGNDQHKPLTIPTTDSLRKLTIAELIDVVCDTKRDGGDRIQAAQLLTEAKLADTERESAAGAIILLCDHHFLSLALPLLEKLKPTSDATVESLIAGLKDRDRLIRYRNARVLGKFGVRAKRAVPDLTALLWLREPVDVFGTLGTRGSALNALAEIARQAPELIPGFIGLTKDKFRSYVVERLLERIGPTALPALREADKHEDPQVREAAARVVRRLTMTTPRE